MRSERNSQWSSLTTSGQLSFAFEPVAQRFAGDERHHIVEQSLGGSAVEQWEDMRVLEARGGPDLRQKAIGPECGAEIRVEDLDRDIAIVLAIVCEVDGGHATFADFALDLVTVSKGGGQAINGSAHRSSRSIATIDIPS